MKKVILGLLGKRFSVVFLCMIMMGCVFSANSFADMKPLIIEGRCSLNAYQAKIVGANFDSPQKITILTTANEKNYSPTTKAAIIFTDKDMPFGLVLAQSMGKNIQVFFPGDSNSNQCKVEYLSIVTDGYWYLP